jgi:SAM-dependent methyltransferase
MAEAPNNEGQIRELKIAGSAARTFNVPLSDERAVASIDFVGRSVATNVVDFGCGNGKYLQLLVGSVPSIRGLGIDLDGDSIQAARVRCISADLSDRLLFEEGDASQHRGPADVSICIGASHVFGDTDAMFCALGFMKSTVAVIGDGVWMSAADSWSLATFGDMPIGISGLAEIAKQHGWSVDEASLSTLDEWDAFEGLWNDGVRSAGTKLARSFAAQRAKEYQRYRGIVGFGWLHLTRG